MAPSIEMIQLQRDALAEAVDAGQLGAAADSDEAIHVLSIFISGAVGQAIANEPDLSWGTGRYTPLLPRLIDLLVVLYPPTPNDPDQRQAAPQASDRQQNMHNTQPTPTPRASRSAGPQLNRA
jgi:hypothetical protein